jgi:hypothetical protein
MATLIRCTCCQSELTAPQFYNGFPYGYTCITKVDPSYKRTKRVYVACEAFKQVSDSTTTRLVVNVKVAGKWVQVVGYGASSVDQHSSSTYMQDSILFVAEDKVK